MGSLWQVGLVHIRFFSWLLCCLLQFRHLRLSWLLELLTLLLRVLCLCVCLCLCFLITSLLLLLIFLLRLLLLLLLLAIFGVGKLLLF